MASECLKKWFPRKWCALSFVIFGAIILTTPAANAALVMPAVFSDHMVLQQGAKVAVWGTADAGSSITVRFRGQTKVAKTDTQGAWKIYLDPLTAAADQTGTDLIVEGGGTTITIHDVLVGEVWLGSGQSNMVWRCDLGARPEDTGAATLPGLRLIGASDGTKYGRKMEWQVCSPQTVGGWSALMFYAGRELHQKLQVPVGLIVIAVGATPASAWISSEEFHGRSRLSCSLGQLVPNPAALEGRERSRHRGMGCQVRESGNCGDRRQTATASNTGRWPTRSQGAEYR